ncbi:IclR family transcriptional regulator [Nocardioides sp. AN3]
MESVDRALRLLLMFRDHPNLRIVDAAKELGVANSTVHRALAMLVQNGFVSKDSESRSYVMGEVLVDLGIRARSSNPADLARPAMTELAARLNETVALGVLRGRQVLFVAEVEIDRTVRVRSQLGTRISAFPSSVGQVHLADWSADRFREAYPDNILRDEATGLTMSRRDYESILAEVRSNGHATNVRVGESSYVSIAVPISRNGRVVAGLAAALPLQRVTDDWSSTATGELHRAARRIEAEAGL